MPSTINGCGTHYYGKKNVETYPGVCQACKKEVMLSSYDTGHYVVILFIPIIPLGKKRILDQCPICTRHAVVSMNEYVQSKINAQDRIQSYRNSPEDARLADEVIVQCVGFRDVETLLGITPLIEEHHAGNPEILKLLAGAYTHFGRLEEAERVLVASIYAKDEDETREALAECLLNQGRPDEAAPQLQHIIDENLADRAGYLFMLAGIFQVKGDHGKALEYYAHCERLDPEFARDRNFIRLRAESEKHLGTEVPVSPSQVIHKVTRQAGWKRFRQIAVVVLLLAVVGYFTLSWVQATKREIYVVNGLHKSYTIDINGDQLKLPPGTASRMRTGEGEIEFQILGLDVPVESQRIAIRSNFLTRPFDTTVFVLNPDGAALLEQKRVYYSQYESSKTPEPEVFYFAGNQVYEFSGLEFVFRQFPKSITLESEERDTPRDGVNVIKSNQDIDLASTFVFLGDTIGKDDALLAVQQHLRLEPEREEFLVPLTVLSEPGPCAEFLRQGIERRPVEVQWHRHYQQAMQRASQEVQLEAEYEALLKAHPADKDILYLAGRCSRDIDTTLERFRQAAEGEDACPYAVNALAGHHLGMGHFEESADMAARALAMLPEDELAQWQYLQAMIAAHRYDQAVQLLRANQAKPYPWCVAAYFDEAYIHTIRDKKDEVRSTFDRMKTRFKEWHEEDAVEENCRNLGARLAYAVGDDRLAASTLKDSSDISDQMVAHLIMNDPVAAADCLEEDVRDARPHLILYLAATEQGNNTLAEKQLALAIKMKSEGDDEDRAYAEALAGESTLASEDLLRLWHPAGEKALILAVLGLRDPENREAYFELARKLNFDKRFPHLLIKRATAQRPL